MRFLIYTILSFFIATNIAAVGLSDLDVTKLTKPSNISTASEANEKSSSGSAGKSVYIVQLADPSVAAYEGGIEGLEATSNRATGATRLDVYSRASKAYEKHLSDSQDQFKASCERALGQRLNVKYKYQHAFNGVAMELTPEQAASIARLPNVKSIAPERMEKLDTDVGPQFIKAQAIWKGVGHLRKSKGEGIVVAILDSGINFTHPSFADIGGDGYDHNNPLGSGNYIPGSHCDVVDPTFCNDKLIGAWDLTGPADGDTPDDSDGHGSHTAATAAGNVIDGATLFAPTTSVTRDISGVAPHANIIAYDVCIDSCPGSALLAAINQVVIDAAALPNGIHALNYSISGGNNPYSDPIELGFLDAMAAGVYVSTSAGNSGPGPATTGHNSPWVAATGALTHNRKVENSLVDLTSDGATLADIVSAGFTSGYGPAPIVHARDFPTSNGSQNDTDPAQCLDPFPAGHFNGEIVVCDRGAIARVEKGANVLAGGAGGFVLANTASSGESVVADAHVLPGVHIGFTAAQVLSNWLLSETNTMATITGFSLSLDKANGDIMAGFSSRGPNTAIDVIKPDIAGPGVSIFAAEAQGQTTPPEYQFLSGTSMSSPHNAGAGALMSAVRPKWSPFAIKSALMMTAKVHGVLKEDGQTQTDPFDVGAGRINLRGAPKAGLILDETRDNFLAADPALGGDPKTLNIASMQDGTCVGRCGWERTVTNPTRKPAIWEVKAKSKAEGLVLKAQPEKFMIKPGGSRTIKVRANTTLAPAGWSFGELKLEARGHNKSPDLHMPIAIQSVTSSNSVLFKKTVDKAEAKEDDVLTYQIDITNGGLDDVIDLSDRLPKDLDYVDGSATETVTGGTTIAPFQFDGKSLTWSGTLDVGGVAVGGSPVAPPFGGYVSLRAIGLSPITCSASCDDTSITISGLPAFTYGGKTYTDIVVSTNGIAIPGTDSTNAFDNVNQNLPDPTPPNGIAPFWTDLDLDGTDPADTGAGDIFVATAGSDAIIIEWSDVEVWNIPGQTFSFQLQILTNATGAPGIWIVYDQLPFAPSALTVGAEADTGVGTSIYYNGVGTFPVTGVPGTLLIADLIGGTAQFTFQAKVDDCDDDKKARPIVNRANVVSGDNKETAIAVTRCADDDN